jgi:aerobic-type carbon monoxide dehydrogenase small subunit (CoxS/CutS family)
MTEVKLRVNQATVACDVPDDEVLLDTLRDRLDLRSVRYCCGIGVCGTCTVQLDGRPVSSCLLLTVMVGDRAVRTAESFEPGDPVPAAFVGCGAYQCSYCLPGMLLTAEAALADNPDMSAAELRDVLAGNLCRCGSYPQVMEAVSRLTEGH